MVGRNIQTKGRLVRERTRHSCCNRCNSYTYTLSYETMVSREYKYHSSNFCPLLKVIYSLPFFPIKFYCAVIIITHEQTIDHQRLFFSALITMYRKQNDLIVKKGKNGFDHYGNINT